MGGVLLLISKDKRNRELFSEKTRKLGFFVNELFKDHFETITSKKFNTSAYVIEFRNDNRRKFFMDELNNWLTFEGIVFALDKTKNYDAEELLSLYREYGEDFVKKLDGHFVIKIYDAQKDEFLVLNDFIKYKSNFFVEDENFYLFTPLLLTAAIIQKPELDLDAFNEFMWRYSILSERSMLKGVTRLSPASIYRINKDGMKIKIYWEWPHHYIDLPFNDAVDKMINSIKETVRLVDQSFESSCLDFTMGQDSRMLVSAFMNQDLPFVTSTFGKDTFFEVQAVKKMVKKYGIKNYNIQINDDYLNNIWKYFTSSIDLGSAELPGYLMGRILHMKYEQLKLGDALVNGSDGQFYKNGLWVELYTLNLYMEPRKVNINLFLRLRAMSKNYFDGIFTPGFLSIKQNSADYYREIMQNEIKDYLHSPVAIQMDKYSLYRWTNFLNAQHSTISLIANSMSPLLLRRNLDFALQIPVQWKFNSSRFQRAVVYNLNPDLAREKTDMGGINMVPKNFFTYIPFWLRYSYFQSRRMRNKIKTILGFHVDTELQEAWDYLPVYQRTYHSPELYDLLNYKDMILAEIIKENEWNNYLQIFKDPKKHSLKNYEFLFKLAGIEYFLRNTYKLLKDS